MDLRGNFFTIAVTVNGDSLTLSWR